VSYELSTTVRNCPPTLNGVTCSVGDVVHPVSPVTGAVGGTGDNSAELVQCYGPLYYAAAARWGAVLDSPTVLHEPSSGGVWGMNSVVTLNILTIRNFIKGCYPMVYAANPSTAVGSASVTSPWASQEEGYWDDWLANLAPAGSCGASACMDYFALDVYPMSWDVSVYGATGGQFMCATASTSSGSPCYSQPILSNCLPSVGDTNNDCQWFIPSSSYPLSGGVLASASYVSGGTFGSSGTCQYDVSNGAPVPQVAALTVTVSGGTVSGIAVTNVGGAFLAAPTHATYSAGAACAGTITISSTLANYAIGGSLDFGAKLAASALAIGKPVRVNESNRPVYVLADCTPQSANGIFDPDYMEWSADGMDTAWFSTIAAWASAIGFSSLSPFATEMWPWYNSININAIPPCPGPTGANNCPSPAAYEIPYLGLQSPTGAYWQRLTQWQSVSLQGNSKLQGNVKLQ